MSERRCSVVVPVYRNAESLPAVVQDLVGLQERLGDPLETVFVVDGSPDDSHAVLCSALEGAGIEAVVIDLSRNFGAFSAVRAGLSRATGSRIAVMAADRQEPIELIEKFLRALDGDVDVVVGQRVTRQDPLGSRINSAIFWATYRRFVQPELPPGGVDVFGCRRVVRDALLGLPESNTSLVGQLFWLGFRREVIPYERRAREHGESGWTLRKKLRYLSDSVFAFTDLPIRLLTYVGALGMTFCLVAGALVFGAWALQGIPVKGYTALMLTLLFCTAQLTLALGIVGSYVWRAYENTKERPSYLVSTTRTFGARAQGEGAQPE